MQHECRLLLPGLYRYKPHRRPLNGFTDCRRVVGVILAALEIGFHIGRWHQPDRMPELLQLSAPMMRGRTCLNANQARRQISKTFENLRTTDTLADYHRAIGIDA